MIILKRTASDNPDFIELTRLLDIDLWQRNPDTQEQYDGFNRIDNNKTVVIAYWDNEPMGCACIKKLDVKRLN